MTSALVQARVGAGKTQIAQARILALKRESPLAKVWVLLATERQMVDFRQRLTDQLPGSTLFNIEFFNFYTLHRHILAMAGSRHHRVDEIVRDGLLRHVLETQSAAGALPILSPIASAPGLIRAVGDLIYELKQNLVSPDAMDAAAARMPPKVRELAAVYRAYQGQLIAADIVDREGEGWLALDVLHDPDWAGLASDVDLLVVDGYDQFSVIQARLLAALSVRVKDTLITLTETDAARAATIGRRFERARRRLDEEFDREGVDLQVEMLADSADVHRHSALRHLSAHLMRHGAPKMASADGAIHLIEAPDARREAQAVMKQIKRRLLDGVHPERILIALREYTRYAPLIAEAARAYSVPLLLHYGDPIRTNPAVIAVSQLLDLHASDFRRNEALDALRSPYFSVAGLGEAEVDALEAVSALVISGRDEWDAALSASVPAAADDEDGEVAESPDPALMARIREALNAFFDAVTPPESGALADYVAWLDGLIGFEDPEAEEGAEPIPAATYTLSLPAQIRANPDTAARDLAALSALKRRLAAMLEAEALFAALGIARRYSRDSFVAMFRSAVESAAVDARAARDGRVLVTTAADARGLPHAHVYILGMAEGGFPAPLPEDRLLTERERQALLAAGARIGLRSESADDEGVFYELINLASDSLTLSRPYTADGGLLPPSHLWRAVERLFHDLPLTRIALSAAPTPEDAATLEEAAIVAAAPENAAHPIRAWLTQAHHDWWTRLDSARAAESARIAGRADDGQLRDADLIALAGQGIADRTWSASQLNELGTCAYRFFAHRFLSLEALRTPEAGMDVLQRGGILHEILDRVYTRLSAEGVALQPEHLDGALAALHDAARAVFAAAPGKYGFRPSATWHGEQTVMLRQLEALIRDDFGDGALNKKFGAGRRVYATEKGFEGDLPLIDDGTLHVRGIIDRIDHVGGRYILIDYKSGSGTTAYSIAQLERGRNMQLWVYMLAAERALRLPTAGAAFLHIPNRKISGALTADYGDLVSTARTRLTQVIDMARRGDFSAEPNGREGGKCAAHCDYARLCRIAVRARGGRDDAGE
jgi:ATP-dependent helicase/nuclease subunit B